jgi:hypothetical protein
VNLKWFWQHAIEEGKKQGSEEERRLAYKGGYDEGYADGQTDALADKSTFDKHCSEGFCEGLTIGFKNGELAGREAERKMHGVQTTVSIDSSMQTTTATIDAATQTSASTNRVKNMSQTVAMDRQQPECVQQAMQAATSIKNTSNDTHDMSTAPTMFQQQPQATTMALARNAVIYNMLPVTEYIASQCRINIAEDRNDIVMCCRLVLSRIPVWHVVTAWTG